MGTSRNRVTAQMSLWAPAEPLICADDPLCRSCGASAGPGLCSTCTYEASLVLGSPPWDEDELSLWLDPKRPKDGSVVAARDGFLYAKIARPFPALSGTLSGHTEPKIGDSGYVLEVSRAQLGGGTQLELSFDRRLYGAAVERIYYVLATKRETSAQERLDLDLPALYTRFPRASIVGVRKSHQKWRVRSRRLPPRYRAEVTQRDWYDLLDAGSVVRGFSLFGALRLRYEEQLRRDIWCVSLWARVRSDLVVPGTLCLRVDRSGDRTERCPLPKLGGKSLYDCVVELLSLPTSEWQRLVPRLLVR